MNGATATSAIWPRTSVGYLRVLLVLLGTAASVASAHPFHATLSEIEWNAQTSRLEVAVRVDPGDLERALRARTGRRLVLEHETEDARDGLLAEFVKETFRVAGFGDQRAGRPWKAQVHFVGHELAPRFAWLYFELSFPGDVRRLEITQSMFTAVVPRQVNLVTARVGRWTGTIHCTADRPTGTLVLPLPLRRPK